MIKRGLPGNTLSKEAVNLFKRNRFREASVLFEKANLVSPSLFNSVLHASSCILSDNFVIAEGVISVIKKKYPDSPCGLQLENYLFLKGTASIESLILRLTESLEKFPDDGKTRKILRKAEKASVFIKLQKSVSIFDMVDIPSRPARTASPVSVYAARTPRRRRGLGSMRVLVISVVSLAAAAGIILNFSAIGNFIAERVIGFSFMGENQKIDEADISGMMYPLTDRIVRDKPLIFYTSDSEVRAEYDTARINIKKGEYNKALYSLNRIVNSNSNIRVKDKASYLIKYISGIEDKPSSGISYTEIMKSPDLYAGFTVRWKGKAGNVRIKKAKTTFSLLIDYSGKGDYSGNAEVFLPFETKIENGGMVEIKGTFVNAIGRERIPYVKADEVY